MTSSPDSTAVTSSPDSTAADSPSCPAGRGALDRLRAAEAFLDAADAAYDGYGDCLVPTRVIRALLTGPTA